MGNGPGCADPQNPTKPSDCQNKDIVYFGFGMTTNASWLQPVYDVDIYTGVTRDGGLSFSPTQAITSGDIINENPDAVEDWGTQLKV